MSSASYVAVSSQGTHLHLGAKSANWLASCIVNLVFNFWNPDKAESCNEVEAFTERWQLQSLAWWYRVPKKNVLTSSSPAGRCHFPWIFSHFQDKSKV